MPFLALTAAGLAAAIDNSGRTGTAIWCGNDLATVAQQGELAERGVQLHRLAYPLTRATPEMMIRTLATIAARHPGEPVWIEAHGRGTY